METLAAGSKGGSTGSPTQAVQSLKSTAYAHILDLLSEGPVYGPAIAGDQAQSVFYNGTPLQNADGTNNFVVQALQTRPGTLDQTYISGFVDAGNDVAVGIRLTQAVPYTHTVTNLALNAINFTLSVDSLNQTSAENGNIAGWLVAYQIQMSVDSGAFSVVVDDVFEGATYSTYTRTHRIDLVGATSSYQIRIVRNTIDNTNPFINDNTNVVSYTEITDAQLRYPGSALVATQIDSSQFSSIPTRSYLWKGLLVKYPSNYNPTTRVYTGTWDGTFVTGWTDNPAWIFYDLVTNNRYGAGRWVTAAQIDRYALYVIGTYCDVLVSDGLGGMEPRFTCNCYITSQAGAFSVLQNLASIFRGMAYYSAGSIAPVADMPQDPAYVYTAANTIAGSFTYTGSSLKTRYTTAQVTWNDPQNQYKPAVEYVEDSDGVALYGINNAQMTAFGCTSRGQAQRVGHWMLLTSRYETQVCKWGVGLDGTLVSPGQVVAIADPARSGRRMGGRITSAANTQTITLDKVMAEAVVGNTITINMPSGVAETHTINGISGNTVTTSTGFSVTPKAQCVWMIESTAVESQLFRVLSISDSGGIGFEITATEYNPSKFTAIDNGAAIDTRSITGSTINVQVPPSGVSITQYVVVDQGTASTNMNISWNAAAGAIGYTVQWQKDSGEWVTAGTTGGLTINVPGIYSGSYLARVSAINAFSIASPYAYGTLTAVTGKVGAPPVVAAFTATTNQVFAITLNWSYPAGAGDTQYAEIYYSTSSSFSSATEYSRFSYPTTSAQLLGLAAGVSLFFWIRLVDTTGNIGAFYPSQTTAGINGQSNSNGSDILSYLTGQITASQLGQALLTPIQAIPGIQSTVANMAGSVTANTTAITNETSQRVAADSSLAQQIAIISATYVVPPMAGDPTTFAGASTIYAGVWSELTARAQADLALAQSVDTVTAQVQSGVSNLSATIQTETTARVTNDQALATQVTTVQSNVNTNTAAIQTTNTALTTLTNSTATSLTNIQANVTAGDSANASAITNVQAQVTANNNTLTAAVQTNANSYAALNGQVSAAYTIKTQITANGRTYIAGIGIGTSNTGGIIESQVLVSASTFAVLDPNGTAVTSPFVIQGGQTFINQAFIGTGYITNAMIGSFIQSNSLGANGLPRWQIDKNGTLTMNGASNGSGYLTLNDSTVSVFDGSGTLRVRMGLW
jgi:predicted phage tail protein